MNKNAFSLSICIILLALSINIFANQNDSIKNTLSFVRVGYVSPSPDGKSVAYSVMHIEKSLNNNHWVYYLYLKKYQGKITLLNRNTKLSLQPFWTPDGQVIAFLAPGKKFQSIWIENINTKTAKKIYESESDISSFKWSPNGKLIAFVTSEDKKHSSMLTDVGTNYNNDRLYVISLNQTSKVLAKAITSADYSISQGFTFFPWRNDFGFDWSPDSQSIVFAYQPRAGMNDGNLSKIAIVNLNDHSIKTIDYTNNHASNEPFFSPNGEWIAFRTNLNLSQKPLTLVNNLYVNSKICLFNITNEKIICLANTFNENPVIIGWNARSDAIYAMDLYRTIGPRIYKIDINPSAPAKLISNVDGFIDPLTFSLNNSRTIFGFRYETPHNAPEPYISPVEDFKLEKVKALRSFNKEKLGDSSLIQWKSKDGLLIEGLLITPENYNPKHKYPLFVDVHGGPAVGWAKRYIGGCDEYNNMFVPSSCYQNLLDLGFIILQPNPRGSSGYGKEFRMRNYADFGGGDYQDVISGVDYLIKKGIADQNHLAIGGWSYGAYLTTWAISQTNQFKAAIDGDGRTDMMSYAGNTDIQWFLPNYLGEYFWNNNQLYLQRSPISFVKNIKTPLLILHGQQDTRVPIAQSYELYNALNTQHQLVKMIVAQNTEHAPQNAEVILEEMNEINTWLKKVFT